MKTDHYFDTYGSAPVDESVDVNCRSLPVRLPCIERVRLVFDWNSDHVEACICDLGDVSYRHWSSMLVFVTFWRSSNVQYTSCPNADEELPEQHQSQASA